MEKKENIFLQENGQNPLKIGISACKEAFTP